MAVVNTNVWIRHSENMRTLYLSVGTAVHARLCDVPAVICCIDTPSKPSTFLGLVIGVEVWPCPHWPIVLFPQAYTSFSVENSVWTPKKYNILFTIIVHLFFTMGKCKTVAVSTRDINNFGDTQVLDELWPQRGCLRRATPKARATAPCKHLMYSNTNHIKNVLYKVTHYPQNSISKTYIMTECFFRSSRCYIYVPFIILNLMIKITQMTDLSCRGKCQRWLAACTHFSDDKSMQGFYDLGSIHTVGVSMT